MLPAQWRQLRTSFYGFNFFRHKTKVECLIFRLLTFGNNYPDLYQANMKIDYL